MVSLAKKGGWIGFIIFLIESNRLESLDVNAADQYTFSRLKFKTTD